MSGEVLVFACIHELCFCRLIDAAPYSHESVHIRILECVVARPHGLFMLMFDGSFVSVLQ